MSESYPPPNWSFQFLKTMLGVMCLSPVVGALIYLLAGQALGWTDEPLAIALSGAKTLGLIGGFAAPLVALGLVAKEINQRAARGKPTAPKTTED